MPDIDADLEILENRLQLLYTVLRYDSYDTKVLTILERMQINQERGALIDMISYLKGEHPANIKVRSFKVSKPLKKKIREIDSRIKSRRLKSNNTKEY